MKSKTFAGASALLIASTASAFNVDGIRSGMTTQELQDDGARRQMLSCGITMSQNAAFPNSTHYMISKIVRVAALPAVLLIAACGQTSAILAVDKSTSQFGSSSFAESVTLSDPTPGNEQYRIFQQGATGYVSIQSVRDDIEQRAVQFCDRKGRSMNGLKETKSVPPYILGNFPRAELIFECVDKPAATAGAPTEDVKFNRLSNLKKLLDNGTLTQAEFEREKAKILNQP